VLLVLNFAVGTFLNCKRYTIAYTYSSNSVHLRRSYSRTREHCQNAP